MSEEPDPRDVLYDQLLLVTDDYEPDVIFQAMGLYLAALLAAMADDRADAAVGCNALFKGIRTSMNLQLRNTRRLDG